MSCNFDLTFQHDDGGFVDDKPLKNIHGISAISQNQNPVPTNYRFNHQNPLSLPISPKNSHNSKDGSNDDELCSEIQSSARVNYHSFHQHVVTHSSSQQYNNISFSSCGDLTSILPLSSNFLPASLSHDNNESICEFSCIAPEMEVFHDTIAPNQHLVTLFDPAQLVQTDMNLYSFDEITDDDIQSIDTNQTQPILNLAEYGLSKIEIPCLSNRPTSPSNSYDKFLTHQIPHSNILCSFTQSYAPLNTSHPPEQLPPYPLKESLTNHRTHQHIVNTTFPCSKLLHVSHQHPLHLSSITPINNLHSPLPLEGSFLDDDSLSRLSNDALPKGPNMDTNIPPSASSFIHEKRQKKTSRQAQTNTTTNSPAMSLNDPIHRNSNYNLPMMRFQQNSLFNITQGERNGETYHDDDSELSSINSHSKKIAIPSPQLFLTLSSSHAVSNPHIHSSANEPEFAPSLQFPHLYQDQGQTTKVNPIQFSNTNLTVTPSIHLTELEVNIPQNSSANSSFVLFVSEATGKNYLLSRHKLDLLGFFETLDLDFYTSPVFIQNTKSNGDPHIPKIAKKKSLFTFSSHFDNTRITTNNNVINKFLEFNNPSRAINANLQSTILSNSGSVSSKSGYDVDAVFTPKLPGLARQNSIISHHSCTQQSIAGLSAFSDFSFIQNLVPDVPNSISATEAYGQPSYDYTDPELFYDLLRANRFIEFFNCADHFYMTYNVFPFDPKGFPIPNMAEIVRIHHENQLVVDPNNQNNSGDQLIETVVASALAIQSASDTTGALGDLLVTSPPSLNNVQLYSNLHADVSFSTPPRSPINNRNNSLNPTCANNHTPCSIIPSTPQKTPPNMSLFSVAISLNQCSNFPQSTTTDKKSKPQHTPCFVIKLIQYYIHYGKYLSNNLLCDLIEAKKYHLLYNLVQISLCYDQDEQDKFLSPIHKIQPQSQPQPKPQYLNAETLKSPAVDSYTHFFADNIPHNVDNYCIMKLGDHIPYENTSKTNIFVLLFKELIFFYKLGHFSNNQFIGSITTEHDPDIHVVNAHYGITIILWLTLYYLTLLRDYDVPKEFSDATIPELKKPVAQHKSTLPLQTSSILKKVPQSTQSTTSATNKFNLPEDAYNFTNITTILPQQYSTLIEERDIKCSKFDPPKPPIPFTIPIVENTSPTNHSTSHNSAHLMTNLSSSTIDCPIRNLKIHNLMMFAKQFQTQQTTSRPDLPTNIHDPRYNQSIMQYNDSILNRFNGIFADMSIHNQTRIARLLTRSTRLAITDCFNQVGFFLNEYCEINARCDQSISESLRNAPRPLAIRSACQFSNILPFMAKHRRITPSTQNTDLMYNTLLLGQLYDLYTASPIHKIEMSAFLHHQQKLCAIKEKSSSIQSPSHEGTPMEDPTPYCASNWILDSGFLTINEQTDEEYHAIKYLWLYTLLDDSQFKYDDINIIFYLLFTPTLGKLFSLHTSPAQFDTKGSNPGQRQHNDLHHRSSIEMMLHNNVQYYNTQLVNISHALNSWYHSLSFLFNKNLENKSLLKDQMDLHQLQQFSKIIPTFNTFYQQKYLPSTLLLNYQFDPDHMSIVDPTANNIAIITAKYLFFVGLYLNSYIMYQFTICPIYYSYSSPNTSDMNSMILSSQQMFDGRLTQNTAFDPPKIQSVSNTRQTMHNVRITAISPLMIRQGDRESERDSNGSCISRQEYLEAHGIADTSMLSSIRMNRNDQLSSNTFHTLHSNSEHDLNTLDTITPLNSSSQHCMNNMQNLFSSSTPTEIDDHYMTYTFNNKYNYLSLLSLLYNVFNDFSSISNSSWFKESYSSPSSMNSLMEEHYTGKKQFGDVFRGETSDKERLGSYKYQFVYYYLFKLFFFPLNPGQHQHTDCKLTLSTLFNLSTFSSIPSLFHSDTTVISSQIVHFPVDIHYAIINTLLQCDAITPNVNDKDTKFHLAQLLEENDTKNTDFDVNGNPFQFLPNMKDKPFLTTLSNGQNYPAYPLVFHKISAVEEVLDRFTVYFGNVELLSPFHSEHKKDENNFIVSISYDWRKFKDIEIHSRNGSTLKSLTPLSYTYTQFTQNFQVFFLHYLTHQHHPMAGAVLSNNNDIISDVLLVYGVALPRHLDQYNHQKEIDHDCFDKSLAKCKDYLNQLAKLPIFHSSQFIYDVINNSDEPYQYAQIFKLYKASNSPSNQTVSSLLSDCSVISNDVEVDSPCPSFIDYFFPLDSQNKPCQSTSLNESFMMYTLPMSVKWLLFHYNLSLMEGFNDDEESPILLPNNDHDSYFAYYNMYCDRIKHDFMTYITPPHDEANTTKQRPFPANAYSMHYLYFHLTLYSIHFYINPVAHILLLLSQGYDTSCSGPIHNLYDRSTIVTLQQLLGVEFSNKKDIRRRVLSNQVLSILSPSSPKPPIPAMFNENSLLIPQSHSNEARRWLSLPVLIQPMVHSVLSNLDRTVSIALPSSTSYLPLSVPRDDEQTDIFSTVSLPHATFQNQSLKYKHSPLNLYQLFSQQLIHYFKFMNTTRNYTIELSSWSQSPADFIPHSICLPPLQISSDDSLISKSNHTHLFTLASSSNYPKLSSRPHQQLPTTGHILTRSLFSQPLINSQHPHYTHSAHPQAQQPSLLSPPTHNAMNIDNINNTTSTLSSIPATFLISDPNSIINVSSQSLPISPPLPLLRSKVINSSIPIHTCRVQQPPLTFDSPSTFNRSLISTVPSSPTYTKHNTPQDLRLSSVHNLFPLSFGHESTLQRPGNHHSNEFLLQHASSLDSTFFEDSLFNVSFPPSPLPCSTRSATIASPLTSSDGFTNPTLFQSSHTIDEDYINNEEECVEHSYQTPQPEKSHSTSQLVTGLNLPPQLSLNQYNLTSDPPQPSIPINKIVNNNNYVEDSLSTNATSMAITPPTSNKTNLPRKKTSSHKQYYTISSNFKLNTVLQYITINTTSQSTHLTTLEPPLPLPLRNVDQASSQLQTSFIATTAPSFPQPLFQSHYNHNFGKASLQLFLDQNGPCSTSCPSLHDTTSQHATTTNPSHISHCCFNNKHIFLCNLIFYFYTIHSSCFAPLQLKQPLSLSAYTPAARVAYHTTMQQHFDNYFSPTL